LMYFTSAMWLHNSVTAAQDGVLHWEHSGYDVDMKSWSEKKRKLSFHKSWLC
jgi:hypothetical protein